MATGCTGLPLGPPVCWPRSKFRTSGRGSRAVSYLRWNSPLPLLWSILGSASESAMPFASKNPACVVGGTTTAIQSNHRSNFQVADTPLRQAVSLSSLRQCGHRKTRISVSTPAGTIAVRFISAVQRQSGSSVEPATSRRSNFDMTPPVPVGKCGTPS